MKKKIILISVFLFVLLVSFIIGVWLRTKTESPAKEEPVKTVTAQKSSVRFKQLMGEALKKKEDLVKSENYDCKEELGPLLLYSVEELKAFISQEEVKLTEGCLSSLNKLESPILKQEMQKCLQDKSIKSAEACTNFIAFMRSYMLTREAKGKEIKDMEFKELVAELLWNFSKTPNLSKEDVEKNLLITDEMIDRDPTMFDAYKAKLVNLFVAEMNHGKKVDEVFDETLKDIKNLPNVDPELDSLPLVREASKGNWDKVEAWADERMEMYPEDFRGYYAKSAAFWYKKNADEAIRYMNRAVKLSPNDPDLQATLRGLKTKDYGMGHFQLKLGFKFDDF